MAAGFLRSYRDVIRHKELLTFCAGLMADPGPLVEYVGNLFVQNHIHLLVKDHSIRVFVDIETLVSIAKESGCTFVFGDIFSLIVKQRAKLDVSEKDFLPVLRSVEGAITQSLEASNLSGPELIKLYMGHLRDKKLSAVRELTGLLTSETLEKLWIVGLDRSDVQDVAILIRHNVLSLKKLDLSDNHVTGLLPEFLPLDGAPLQSLEELDLNRTDLSELDIRHLGILLQNQKLPALKAFSLRENTLTGLLSVLLPLDVPLIWLEELVLRKTELNNKDVRHLKHLIQKKKLPSLKLLDLSFNNFGNMEADFGELMEVCLTHHQGDLRLTLFLIKLSGGFIDTWRGRGVRTNFGDFYFSRKINNHE